jgi:phosphatidylserine/phosphatidylglycerophosphate/cardiolipin synthase-like enzyme
MKEPALVARYLALQALAKQCRLTLLVKHDQFKLRNDEADHTWALCWNLDEAEDAIKAYSMPTCSQAQEGR